MNRRHFLRTSSLAGISVPVLSLYSCRYGDIRFMTDNEVGDNFELLEVSIDELQQMVADGKYSYKRIAQLYIERIEQLDKEGPRLNSVVELNPDAIGIAISMDEERKNGKFRGPLHGIPVLIKDNIDTADKMQTTAGSLAMEGNYAPADAFLVKKLREAGAVILGKTNLSEWANFRSTRSVSGWSSRGGQTLNPYITNRSPCGSSSGSGVAVAANFCMVAVGTETDGSIACPASMNGIVGIKPTVGLVSRSGIIPISKSQDTAGPMARTVTDATILLSAMAVADANDPASHETTGSPESGYTKFLDRDGLRGKRIGIEKTMLKHHESVDFLLQKTLEQLKACGAELIEVEFAEKVSSLGNDEMLVLEYEFKDGLNAYLSMANGKIKSLKDLIEFNRANGQAVMPYFKQEILESSETKGNLDSPDYKAALSRCRELRDFTIELLENNQLQAICGPATGAAWCIDPVNGDFWTGYGAYSLAAITGFPSITVPMGMVSGLPVGITFMGKAFDEPALISIAYAYEQASKNRVPPGFSESVM